MVSVDQFRHNGEGMSVRYLLPRMAYLVHDSHPPSKKHDPFFGRTCLPRQRAKRLLLPAVTTGSPLAATWCPQLQQLSSPFRGGPCAYSPTAKGFSCKMFHHPNPN